MNTVPDILIADLNEAIIEKGRLEHVLAATDHSSDFLAHSEASQQLSVGEEKIRAIERKIAALISQK
jgi:bacterioferritin (cytochrome b1)